MIQMETQSQQTHLNAQLHLKTFGLSNPAFLAQIIHLITLMLVRIRDPVMEQILDSWCRNSNNTNKYSFLVLTSTTYAMLTTTSKLLAQTLKMYLVSQILVQILLSEFLLKVILLLQILLTKLSHMLLRIKHTQIAQLLPPILALLQGMLVQKSILQKFKKFFLVLLQVIF